MTTPALLALTDPAKAPAAAADMLGDLAHDFFVQAGVMGDYAALMMALSRTCAAARLAVLEALSGGDAVAADNAAAMGRASARLFDELAVRSRGSERWAHARAASWCRSLYACTALIVREHAPSARLVQSSDMPRVRILPGASAAISTLSQDPLLTAAQWDVAGLAAALARWVVTHAD